MGREKGIEKDLMYGKLPPSSIELESAILGAVLLERNKITLVRDIINTSDVFYSEQNKIIWEVICDMDERGIRVDFMTVCEELRKNGNLEMVGGSFYVTSLTRDVVSSAHIEEHARIVIQKYIMRELIRMSGNVISDAYEDATDCFELLDKAQFSIESISTQSVRKQYEHISASTIGVLEEIYERMHTDVKIFGVTSGWVDFDIRFGGFKKDTLTILAARPAVGKTAFALNLLMNAAVNGTPVALFSLEMSKQQLIYRMVSSYTGIEHEKIINGNLTEEEFEIVKRKTLEINSLPIYWDDTAGITVREIRVKSLLLKRKHNIGLIAIDYLQLVEVGIEKGNREQEISYISRQLKKLTKELSTPIIALSQLNRAKDANHRPQLSDLRESGAIEQDADSVIFLWRPTDERKELTCVDVAKHRHGSLGVYGARFLGAIQKFDQLINIHHTSDPKSVVFYENPSALHIQEDEVSKPNAGIGNNGLIKMLKDEDLPF